jgi:hypothetical protein
MRVILEALPPERVAAEAVGLILMRRELIRHPNVVTTAAGSGIQL